MGKWEVIFVLDQSYDDSLQVLRSILLSDTCMGSSLVRARVLIQPTSIFETSSDNLGFTLADKSALFIIEIQSDMFIGETGWNRDMARPLLQYGDIFAVSGRCGHVPSLSRANRNKTTRQWLGSYSGKGRCGRDFAGFNKKFHEEDRNAVHIIGTVNRGPIIFRADVLRKFQYLDEVNFHQGGDDPDLFRRVLHKGWHVAYRYAHVKSPLDLSPAREPKFNAKTPPEGKNQSHFYSVFRKELKNHSCDPDVPFEAFAWDRLPQHPETRPLEPIPDGYNLSTLVLMPLPGHNTGTTTVIDD